MKPEGERKTIFGEVWQGLSINLANSCHQVRGANSEPKVEDDIRCQELSLFHSAALDPFTSYLP